MKQVPFKASATCSIGVELEFQLIDPHSFGLISCAKEFMRHVKDSEFSDRIKPEITQSMIEINSSVHQSPQDLLVELKAMRDVLLQQGDIIHAHVCGGGTHPFQKWSVEKIFPSPRFRRLANKYKFLTKRGTVFGQHIHIGCASSEDALYLTHVLARYVPQLIAMGAASPFYQGVDTGFVSARSTVFNAFPLHGVIPWLLNWQAFSDYFYQMRDWGIIHTMKDFYWDLRPKPEFGTVEIRVTDTPLTVEKAALVAAFAQTLSLYILEKRPIHISPELYYLYETNRFQAARYGFDGDFINPVNSEHILIADDLLATIKLLEPFAKRLNTTAYLEQLQENVLNRHSDANELRKVYKQTSSFVKVVESQCDIWKKDHV